MKKVLFSLLLAGTVLFSVGNVNAKATTNTESGKVIASTMEEVTLTKDEYCKRVAEKEHVSVDKVVERVNQREAKKQEKVKADPVGNLRAYSTMATNSTIYRQINWADVIVNQSGAYCKLRDGFLGTFEGGSGYYYCTAVEGPFVLADGTGTFDWVSGNNVAKIIDNGGQVYFTAAGTVDGVTDISYSAGFKACGFDVSAKTSYQDHVRKFVTLAHTYRVQ